MSDVVDSVLVQADGLDQIDLDFVCGGDPANEILSRFLHGLGRREDGRNVVAGMRIIRGQKRVVHVEFADSGAVGPGGPLRTEALPGVYAEDGCAGGARMPQSHLPSRHNGASIDRGDGHGRVVNDAVDDGLGHLWLNRDSSAATSAIFQASCSSRGSCAEDG